MINRTTIVVIAVLAFTGIAVSIARSLSVPVAAPIASAAVLINTNNGHGSGVHIGNGLFITAAHVIKGTENVTIKLNSGELLPAEVLWANESYDVALLKTDRADIATAYLNCAAPELMPGATIEIVGNPLSLRNIHTFGRVSRVTEQGTLGGKYAFIADITIAPGNSGGPVFNSTGRLVGIVVAMASYSVGFSQSLIPLSYIVPTSAICTLLGR